MEEKKNIFSNKKLVLIIPILFLIIIIGASYAFFNYTRTGGENSIGTGRIYFNTTESRTVTLTNVFPISDAEVANANLDSISLHIVGDTTYTGGEEYEVTLVDVQNIVSNGTIPIHYTATYTATSGKEIGTKKTTSEEYFTDRGSTNNVYMISEEGIVSEGKQILVGYLKSGAAGIDGTLTIKAWISSEDVAISDSYDGTESNSMGTTTEWVDGRTVVTSTEWNNFTGNGAISFKIRTESNEGIWVEEPVQEGTIDSCPGCYFMYTENQYHFGINASTLADIASNNDIYSANYKDIVFRNSNTLSLANNQFLGFTVNNGAIDKAYVCGVAGNTNNLTPFCIEGINNGTANTQSNKDLIMSVFSSAYNPNNIYTCSYHYDNNPEVYYSCEDEEYTTIYSCWSDHSSSKYFECEYSMSDLEPYTAVTFWESSYSDNEFIDVGNGYDHDCYINNGGEFFCVDETN